MIDTSYKHLRNALFVLLAIIITGTSGFMLIEGWNVADSLYMTIITITTTGFEEVHQLSTEGEVFTLILLMVSFGTVIYIGGTGVQILVESKFFRRKKMQKKIEHLKDHYIVCGYGRMGTHICNDLGRAKVPFVVIENNPVNKTKLDELEYLYDLGDASNDETLLRTGVKNAKGLVAVLSSDAENVFTTLSAKTLNPGIFVVARAIDDHTEPKLLKAGANRVVKPYELGGVRMAEILLKPGVMDFIDVVAGNNKIDLQIEEITVKKGSSMDKKTLAELPVRSDLNIIIVSIQNEDKGLFIYNPKGDTIVDEGNKLIAIGERDNLEKLKNL
ncbi:MAG: TrkA family potassium uptake protein [Ignavibacteriaceae bacterium]|nr:TrkA family potassium uptake protein [Ignavibacteriaceae bacterium]